MCYVKERFPPPSLRYFFSFYLIAKALLDYVLFFGSSLCETESFRAFVDSLEKVGSQLVVRFIDGQVELIEASKRSL